MSTAVEESPLLVTSPLFGKQAPAWVKALREEGRESFAALGVPTTRHEDWRYTNLAPLAKATFEISPAAPFSDDVRQKVAQLTDGKPSLVFVNGRLSPLLSTGHTDAPSPEAPATSLEGLGVVLRRSPERLDGHLDAARQRDSLPFVALNTAHLADGAVVRVPKGVVVAEPIHLVFLSAGPNAAAHLRSRIELGEGSQATIVETYLGDGPGTRFTNSVVEISVGAGAKLTHVKLQLEGLESFHVGTHLVTQEPDSFFASHLFSLGGRLVRNELSTALEEGAHAGLYGLFCVRGSQHVDNHTVTDHLKPHGTSNEYYKGVLDGEARGAFDGKVIVRQNAIKTDAHQKNKNLILSESALVDSKPQLEIFNNDVRCTHGATTGRLDPDALFYLRSRGLSIDEARSLLTVAFARELVDPIPVPSVKTFVEAALTGWFGT